MNKQEFLENIRKQIHFVFDRDSIEQEFNQHIEDSIADLISEGYSKEEAERIAVERMGNPIEIGKQLNEEHHPLLGYLWMVSRLALIACIIPILPILNDYRIDIVNYFTNKYIDEYEETIDINMKVDLEYHTVYIDKIDVVYDDWKYYQIVYHSYLKWNKCRSGASRTMFYVENNGEIYENEWTRNSTFGTYGSISFDGSDGIFNLVFVDGQKIEINLEEYRNEKK